MDQRANVPTPAAWESVAPNLYTANNAEVRRLAEKIGASFGDDTAFPRLRTELAEARAPAADRRHAFAVLSRAQDRDSLPAFVALLDDKAFRSAAIPLLARFDSADIASAIIERFDAFASNDRAAALSALAARPAFALALLDAVAAKKIPRDQITAFQVRQLASLKDSEVDKRVAAIWGRIGQTPMEKQKLINRLEKTFNEAPLWAYNGSAGKQHFELLCASCHKLGNEGTQLGPELTGASKLGVRYFLENIIDPDAVIGTDFQLTMIETKDDESLSGLLVNQTASAVTLRTTAGEVVVPKANIKPEKCIEKG
jgi:putative heme-binding domain-containing protein